MGTSYRLNYLTKFKGEKMNYEYFGIMLDCSGGAVLSVEELKRFILVMEKMGYNLLELCTDDTYKIKDEPYFGYLRGGYTASEIKEVDAFARKHGVELVPCIQTLAHLTNLVKLPHYSGIVDISNILLVDEPKTYELIEKMFASLAETYSSKIINIGMDEAHLLGLGNFLRKNGYQDRFDIFLRHLNKVALLAKKYGFKPHMWSDMFFRLATGCYYKEGTRIPKEVVDRLPDGIGLAYWDYGEHEIKDSIFADMFDAHLEMDREIWFAGGAWTWNGFAPHNAWSLKSMKPAMEQCIAHGVNKVLITIWAGDRCECSYYSVLPSLYAIKQYGLGNFDEESIKKGFYETFGFSYDAMMALDIPNQSKLNPDADKVSSACKTLLYNDCFLGWKDSAIQNEMPFDFLAKAKILKKAQSECKEYGYIFEILYRLCLVLDLKADLGVRTRTAYQKGDKKALKGLIKDYKETEKRIADLYKAFKFRWNKENKPYGWEVYEVRFGGLRSRVLNCKERLEEYLAGKVDTIPELEEEILPYADWKLQYNAYRGLVRVGEI